MIVDGLLSIKKGQLGMELQVKKLKTTQNDTGFVKKKTKNLKK